MTKFRNIAPLVAAGALIGLAGCSQLGLGGSSQQAAATPPAAPPPAAAPQPAPPMAMNEMSPQTLRQVQTSLKREGLYRGRIDGKWGPLTEHAVTAYQQKNGLQATGTLDQPTLEAMHMGGAAGTSSSMNTGGSTAGPSAANGAAGGAPASGTTNP